MVQLWRVRRNRFGKRRHARLDVAGITVSRLDGECRSRGTAATTPDSVSTLAALTALGAVTLAAAVVYGYRSDRLSAYRNSR